jgi:exodeoxyribonuclease V beta subunit
MTELDDLGLRLPIQGVQLIEASAGTGKTFTLATLYARLVIETGLPVSAILAVTYTEAATKELRGRLRARLVLAQRLLGAALAVTPFDPVQDNVDDEETRLTRNLLHAAVAREGAAALRKRLRAACEQMDLAPIHTIHGFCRRALADHALEAGQNLLERELLQNEAALRREVALEFWREQSRAPETAATLAALWNSPEALAASLRELVVIDVLRPEPMAGDGQALAALITARQYLAEQFRVHGAGARELLRAALVAGEVTVTYVKDVAVDAVWDALADWQPSPAARDPATEKLANYGSAHLQLRTRKGKTTPASPLFDAIDAWREAVDAHAPVARAQCVAMIHAARDFARLRMDALKRERGLLGFDDMIRGVADALDGPGGQGFAAALQAQYAVALLDEFQDTDARQWAIFRRLFAEPGPDDYPLPRALFLIGDPKQAIYRFRGGDVFTYLAAQEQAQGKHVLERNFRSRPLALQAVQALFELSGSDVFAQAGIAFEAVQAGGRCSDEDLRLHGDIAPALNVLQLTASLDKEPGDKENIDEARGRATRACVASIHGLLAAGVAGQARLRDRDGRIRPVAPGDIAVLVEKNEDAERFQSALSQAGIPSVAAGRSSVYQTEEAEQLCWLFEALLAPADDQRLRAALAAPLFGLDAAALAAFDEHESEHRAWQDRLQHWQQRAQRFGPMAVLGDLCAEQAPRLLTLRDGERRLSNYLQLAEELQAADAHALGLAGLLAELERRIEDADQANDAELLRLESDAARVKILTLHMSKGLEFELVYLPFAATGGAERRASDPPMARFHDGVCRVALLYPEKGEAACVQEAAEERAERLRLLYVGLTRARLATWLVWGAVNNADKTPLAWLLHRPPGADRVGKLDPPAVSERLAVLRAQAPAAISVVPAVDENQLPRLAFVSDQAAPPAAIARRLLDRDWWVYSFSQLAREDSGADVGGAEDESEPLPSLPYSRFSGTRFGNSLHLALEEVRMERWLDCAGPLPPTGEFDALADALRAQGYNSEADLEEGVPLLTALIAETLNTRMPEGARLTGVPDSARRKEMEFHLALAPTAMPALLDLLHHHGIIRERHAFGLRARLEGLLTGRIDLIYEFAGRYYIVDYKSNQLRDYAADALDAAVRDSEYDLQYLLYSLALHRWLRFRLGSEYDIRQHLGGVRYLFCRGLDRERDDGPGIHALRLPDELIEALDALLQGAPA